MAFIVGPAIAKKMAEELKEKLTHEERNKKEEEERLKQLAEGKFSVILC